MNRLFAVFGLAVFTLAGADQGFVTLFDGKDLKGWQKTPGPWVVENGVLALKGRTDDQMRNENYLWTNQQYGDFVLELEFKVAERSNSGVFIRTSDIKDPVQTGIEIQVASGPGEASISRGSTGGIYDLVAPSKKALKPTAWNKYAITCQGPKITVALNGAVVSEANLDRWTVAHKNPDGSENKFDRPLKDFARQGYIGLQDHGSPVWYRNIRIKVLK